MSQQVLDLRRSVRIVRRRKVLVGVVVALGFLAGAAYAAVYPPTLTGTALVVLPLAVQNAQNGQNSGQAGSTAPSQYMATQAVIAHSDAVLSAARPNVRPAMSLDRLRSEVQVSSPTGYIISISATSKAAADAEANANAVANSYISYINSPSSPIGQPQARMLEPATTATGTRPLQALLIKGLVGALAGLLIGIITALAVGRKDKRLRERDEMANSIGVPVLASVPVNRPSDAAAWMKLFEGYEPGIVHAWRLRKALQQLGMTVATANNGNGTGVGSGGLSLTVLSVSSDPGALALGPQLAVFAASQDIPTTLVVGPQQDMNITATLRTACAVPPPASSKRPRQLRVAVYDSGDVYEPPNTGFVVVVVVVDGRNPQIPSTMRTAATVIGVSAGSATAEQLARIAVVAAVDGREVAGMLVANPDSADHTTGRIPQLAPPTHRKRPTRVRGIATEIRR